MNKSSTTQTILGVEMPLLFIDPMTAVLQESVFDYGDIEFRPKSKIKMIIPELGFARVGTEDQSRRHWRSLLWNSLTNSCKDVISEHVWKDIKKGDCAKLHLRISEHAQANNRREIIRDVNSKFIELRKKKSETFKGFISRYQSICITASRIGYNLDKDYCLLTILDALQLSDDEAAKRCLQRHISQVDHLVNADTLLMKMEEEMLAEETMKTSAKSREAESKQKSKNFKMSVLKARIADLEKMVKNVNSEAGKKKSPCMNFQYGRCKRKKCYFDHVKLSKEEVKKLQEVLDERKKAAIRRQAEEENSDTDPGTEEGVSSDTGTNVYQTLATDEEDSSSEEEDDTDFQ
jgi:hypothetical protein